MRITHIAGALALGLAAPAGAFEAVNGVSVEPAATSFEVIGDAGLGARGVWCAAADYAQRSAGATNSQRLYIARDRARGLGQRGPVAFTLDPEGLTPTSVFILGASLSRAGSNLSVGHALGFCADHKLLRNSGL